MIACVCQELVNGTFILPAKTAVEGGGVSLTVPPGAGEVVGVRYCFQGYPDCVLRNGAGLPAMPFVANVTK